MTESQQAPQAQPETPTLVASPKEIEEGKSFAVLSYVLSFIGLPFFLIPLIMRNNEYSLYHAKQCLILWIGGLVGGVVSGMLMAVCIGAILAPAVWIAMIVFCVMGLMNATKGLMKPLPLIGKFGEEWFKGLKKA
jgi:uncharacterized membrane protein